MDVLRRLVPVIGSLPALLLMQGCGSNPVTPTTPTPTATPTKAATATPAGTPTVAGQCKWGKYPAGPVVRYAISPRYDYDMTHGPLGDLLIIPLKVHVTTPYEDEIWCVDKDLDHRLEFNSNQRNADNKECCWENPPQWWIASDPLGAVVRFGPWGPTAYNFRMRVDTKGQRTTISVQAQLDGNISYEWQSNAWYHQNPLRIQFMSKASMDATCECDYYGNGIYEGPNCKK